MQTKYLLLFFILTIAPQLLKAQEPEYQLPLVEIIEQMAANMDEEPDMQELTDKLEFLYQNKIDLNTATAEQLSELFFLSDIQIKSIISYRDKYKGFNTLYELKFITAIPEAERNMMLPFINLSGKTANTNAKKFKRSGKHNIYARTQFITETQKGYEPPETASDSANRYLGNKYKYYLKYTYTRQKISSALVLEKDQGEPFAHKNQPLGFDFYSGYVQLINTGIIDKMVIGDFKVQLGQGLIVNTGFGSGASVIGVNLNKRLQGVKANTSADEINYLRGVATNLKWKKLRVTLFGSITKNDARLTEIDTNETDIQQFIESMPGTGYHRTLSEIALQNNSTKTIAGAMAGLVFNQFRVNINSVYQHFNPEILPSDNLYQKYYFSGTTLVNTSLDYLYIVKSASFFGEIAIDDNLATAQIHGVNLPLSPFFAFAVMYRNYSTFYKSILSNAYVQNSSVTNEKGLVMAMEIQVAKGWLVTFKNDMYQHPWIAYRKNAPVFASEQQVQINYRKRTFQSYARFRISNTEQNESGSDENLISLEKVQKYTIRLNTKYQYEFLKLANNIDFTKYTKDNNSENGYMLYQDIQYSFKRFPLNLSFRYALFNAPYNARLYAYEHDILHAFSVPAYYYNGTRMYLNVHAKLSEDFDIWFRISQFRYFDRTQISEGTMNEIDKPHKTEIKIQIRYTF